LWRVPPVSVRIPILGFPPGRPPRRLGQRRPAEAAPRKAAVACPLATPDAAVSTSDDRMARPSAPRAPHLIPAIAVTVPRFVMQVTTWAHRVPRAVRTGMVVPLTVSRPMVPVAPTAPPAVRHIPLVAAATVLHAAPGFVIAGTALARPAVVFVAFPRFGLALPPHDTYAVVFTTASAALATLSCHMACPSTLPTVLSSDRLAGAIPPSASRAPLFARFRIVARRATPEAPYPRSKGARGPPPRADAGEGPALTACLTLVRRVRVVSTPCTALSLGPVLQALTGPVSEVAAPTFTLLSSRLILHRRARPVHGLEDHLLRR